MDHEVVHEVEYTYLSANACEAACTCGLRAVAVNRPGSDRVLARKHRAQARNARYREGVRARTR